ncbi:MAG: sigma-70 family RNA polymerase sigma factor [Oscillospiraceae bacterium]|nr:sigma-70 family RNA polymerase sigma factor [Oscillospiraceae bacterium]
MSKKYTMKNGIVVEVSDEIFEILKKSDRRIRYVEEDLKQTRYIINKKKGTTREIPAREDSLDRLTALGHDFADSTADFDEAVLRKIMLEQALEKLSDEERYLITQLFYFGRTERELAAELHQTQQNINKIKQRVLCKLYEILRK